MDQSLFYRWFAQIFLEQTKIFPRPLLLIIDGHGSHFNVETLKLAVENDV
jgi:DDE superfamily endonuclease